VFIDRQQFGLDRDMLAAALEKENLYVRKYYSPPCHKMSAYSTAAGQSLPRTEASASSVIALPVYNNMLNGECDGIAQAFVEVHHAAPSLAHAIV
jgi:dTDP-4-amino-4,6-dideoxy-D-glucose transaminase